MAERGIWHYLGAQDVSEQGNEKERLIREDPTKDKFTKFVQGDVEGAMTKLKVTVFFLGRSGLIIPFLRPIQRVSRNLRGSPPDFPK